MSVCQIIEHACDPREGWNLAFIFNASLSRDSVVCNSGLNCVVQEVLQVDVAKSLTTLVLKTHFNYIASYSVDSNSFQQVHPLLTLLLVEPGKGL